MLSKQKEQYYKKRPEIDPHINDLDQNKLKEFMNYFRADSTKEPDKQLIDYISSNSSYFLETVDIATAGTLAHGRMFADMMTTIENAIELGKNIYLCEEDGSMTTFTEKYLNNDMTDKLQELCSESQNGPMQYGRVLLSAMAMILSEHPAASDILGKNTTVIIAQPHQDIHIIPSKQNPELTQYVELLDETENLGRTIISDQTSLRKKEHTFKEEQKSNQEFLDQNMPPEPVPPREKSGVRRFFCALGFPHSDDYNAQKTKYEEDMHQKKLYEEELKKKMEKVEAVREEYEAKKASMDRMDEQIKENTNKLQEFQNAHPAVFQTLQKQIAAINEIDKKNMELDKKFFTARINDPENIKALLDSKSIPFEPGALAASVYYANRIDLLDNEKDKKRRNDIAAPMIAESILGAKGAANANNMRGKQKTAANGIVEAEQKQRAKDAVECFQMLFCMPCTPENVAYVMDTLNIQDLLNKKIKEDNEKLPYWGDKLKKHEELKEVTEKNCIVVAGILITGLKTLVIESLDKQAEKTAGKKKEAVQNVPKLPEGEPTRSRNIPRLPGM